MVALELSGESCKLDDVERKSIQGMLLGVLDVSQKANHTVWSFFRGNGICSSMGCSLSMSPFCDSRERIEWKTLRHGSAGRRARQTKRVSWTSHVWRSVLPARLVGVLGEVLVLSVLSRRVLGLTVIAPISKPKRSNLPPLRWKQVTRLLCK